MPKLNTTICDLNSEYKVSVLRNAISLLFCVIYTVRVVHTHSPIKFEIYLNLRIYSLKRFQQDMNEDHTNGNWFTEQ